jgi:hypothetical protein
LKESTQERMQLLNESTQQLTGSPENSKFMFGGVDEEEDNGYAQWLLDNRTDVDEFFDALTGRYWDCDKDTKKFILKQNPECALINDVGAMQLRSILRMELQKIGAVSKLDQQTIGTSLISIHLAIARFLARNKKKYEIQDRELIIACLIDVLERHVYRSIGGWEREVQKKSHRIISADRKVTPIDRNVQRNYGKNLW